MMTDVERLPADVRTIADGMSDRDWESLALQLGRYAVQKSRRFYWRTGNSGALPYGEVTESIVSRALFLWLTGRRRWNRAEYADLQLFLKGVIDSLLSHSANGFDNRAIDTRDPSTSLGAAESGYVERDTPESALLAKERARLAEETFADIVRASSEDDVALAIIEALRNGASTRRDIVSTTGFPAHVVDNGLKRLRRTGAQVIRRGHEQALR